MPKSALILTTNYYFMKKKVYSVIENSEMDVQTALESDLVDYDNDLKEIIGIYLQFITDWVHDLVEHNDLSKALYVLDDEWRFCKNNLFYVTDSENMYAKRFCTMSGFLNSSLFEMLRFIDSEYKQKLMEYNHDSNWLGLDTDMLGLESKTAPGQEDEADSSAPEEESETGKHSLYEIREEEDRAEEKVGFELSAARSEEEPDADDARSNETGSQFEENVSDVNLKCNELKEEINRLRKISMKSLKFCGKLIADLELAAKYEVTTSIQVLLDELAATNHVLVHFTNPEFANSSSSFMLFIPHEFSKDKIQIVRLLFIISEKDDYDSTISNIGNKLVLIFFFNGFFKVVNNLIKLKKLS
jgi:hypothetical protein